MDFDRESVIIQYPCLDFKHIFPGTSKNKIVFYFISFVIYDSQVLC